MNRSSNASIESLERRLLLSVSPTLLTDISSGDTSSLPEQFQSLNGNVLFLAYDRTRGQMLWSSDGTPSGTKMIADLNPNPRNGTYQGFGQASIVIGNEMYFAGTDYAHGTELWKTDGTTDGTQLVGDLNPGLDSSAFSGFTNINGKLAFSANGKLWISDGTPQGTQSLGNLNPTGVSGMSDRMTVLGNKLYFFRYATPNLNGHDTGELWSTDGTAAGTSMVVDISPGSAGRDEINADPSNLIAIGNTLYFAGDDGTHGWELYRSDGTAAGTGLVADLAPPTTNGSPSDGSYPSELTAFGGSLYFSASADGGAPVLYRLDPAGAPQIVSTVAQTPTNLTAAGNTLYFTADDSTHGQELWKSDGTAAGTTLVDDINPGSADPSISDITPVGWSVFFSADDGTHGPELWQSDGSTTGTALFGNADQGTSGSSPGNLIALNGKLIFEANVFGVGEEPVAIDLPTPVAPTIQLVARSMSSNRPQVTGNAPAGATAYLYSDGTRVGSTSVESDGSFAVTSSVALSEGTHQLTTNYAYAGQLSAASAPITAVVDTEGATVTLVSASRTAIVLKFSEDVSASFGRGSFSLSAIATGLRVDPSTVRITFNVKKRTATITFKNKAGALGTGHYRLRIAASKAKDTDGNPLTADASFGITIRKKTT